MMPHAAATAANTEREISDYCENLIFYRILAFNSQASKVYAKQLPRRSVVEAKFTKPFAQTGSRRAERIQPIGAPI